MQYIQVENTPTPTGHYSQAVVSEGVAYISGILPTILETGERLAHLSIEEQTKQVLKNLDRVLAAASTSKENVLKLTIFIASASYWGTVNGVCAEYFGSHRPARSIIPVPELYHGTLLELEAIAKVN